MVAIRTQYEGVGEHSTNYEASAGVPSTGNLSTPRLLNRDPDVLISIHECGGVLTSVQLAVLFWPPDLKRRLVRWGSTPQQIRDWLAQYPPTYIDRIIEMLKWGQKLNRLRAAPHIRKNDQKLVEWLHGLPAELANDLVKWLDTLAKGTPADWLANAIGQDHQPPQAFAQRPRFPSEFISSACKINLKRLVDQGFIVSYDQSVRPSEGRAMTCFFLSRSGLDLVAQAKRVASKDLDYKPAGAYGALHLGHRLAINDVRIAMHIHSARLGYRVVEWIDDNQLRRMLAREKVTLWRRKYDPETREVQEVKEVHAVKVPDGYLVLDMGTAGRRHCFIELDNQTLTLQYRGDSTKDYASKIRILAAFYKQGYKQQFPDAGDSMWLLTVTTGGQERLRHLKATTEEVVGVENRAADRYWFTTVDQISTWQDYFGTSMFGRIWLRGGDNGLWALDDPPTGKPGT